MGVLVRAVVYGFGFSLGAALYRRVSEQLGLDDAKSDTPPATPEENASDSAPPPEESE